jgi:hypothetical protein
MAWLVHVPELPQRVLLRISLGPTREKNVDRVLSLAGDAAGRLGALCELSGTLVLQTECAGT